ncbi:MAG: SCO family protein [Candidatus Pedobacter colombiensis]|uniref:SCO family protein n=1 Tax=Candidatus Pedobacter colombiensis TaxID=3121371 RepID=A0AAJ5W5J3_9SPHI|nr:SCO family protein [Pedobacter sp.]WEK17530.1 MAG: SCO family protein [Pedobacter sp.]
MKWSGLYLVLLSLVLFSCKDKPKRLPFLQLETTERTVEGKKVIDSTFRTIPTFKLLNQDSTVVTEKNFDGTIYVADFFFTSCPTICPVMHRNLLKVYQKYKGNPEVKLASHTIDVKYDTPSRMKTYARKLGVEGTQWEYLWGSRDEIYALAERNYLVAAQEDKNAPGGFVHQGYLVLVDKEKRIRGAYDGTQDKDVAQLMSDMDVLLKEYKN